MKLRQLRYFVKIAEAGSYTAASRQLNIAQSALSRQMSEMEGHLGVALLDRGKSGATLTEKGHRFYDRAREILELVEVSENEVRSDVAGTPSGSVSVALSVGVAGLIGPKLVQRVAAVHPGITLTIIDGLGNQTGEAIESGHVDFGLVPDAERLAGVKSEPVVEESIFLASRRAGPDPDARDIELSQVAGLPLVMPARSVHLRHHVEAAFARQGRALNVLYEQQSLGTILSLVTAGVGSVVINWPAVHELWADGKLDVRRVVKPEITRTFSLVAPGAKPMFTAARATYDVLREVVVEQVELSHWKGRLV
ncbi:MAG: LysR family transcriptional regulator [Pseudomonadota bacterium]